MAKKEGVIFTPSFCVENDLKNFVRKPLHIILGSAVLDLRFIHQEQTKAMEKTIYPANFYKDKEHGYRVEFPDLPGCLTDGETPEEAFLMVGDALDCRFDIPQDRPQPTPITEIKAEEGAGIQMVQPAPYLSEGAKISLKEKTRQKPNKRFRRALFIL